MLLEELRQRVCRAHALLPANQLVAWTSGNVSGRDSATGYIVIKPSGLPYSELTSANMVVIDENGAVVEGSLSPSSDAASHCYIYRNMPQVFGVTHTHSRYATAFAAVGKEIPCVLTAIADEFGGSIPCGDFQPIGGDEIGREVVRVAQGSHSPAILLKNHGVFTYGASAESAVKAAVMTEDAAAAVWMAMQIGSPVSIPEETIAQLHYRYTHVYGQRSSKEN